LLAFNALVVTLLILLMIGGALAWFVGRPLMRRVDKVCERADEDQEARARWEQLEREEEARLRVKAEQEIDEQFPHLHEGQGSDGHN
jgi:flagellar biosynthesis/type III secretory pathway M-ring protein FliF/YscJ